MFLGKILEQFCLIFLSLVVELFGYYRLVDWYEMQAS